MSFAHSAARFLDGLTRLAKERYSVSLMDLESGRTRTVASPLASYYADPFVVSDAGAAWLFCEEFHYPTSRGHIAAARLTSDLAPTALKRVLDPGCHASFPFVFPHEGRFFMLPETSRGGFVGLYECDAMPDRWRPVARLLDGVDCADSVLHRHRGTWYLITSEADSPATSNRRLAIYFADALLAETWQPHPVNRERRYAERPHGYGRNAGALVEAGALLLRPMQSSTDYYGQATRIMQVVELSPARFEERPFEGEHILQRIAAGHSTHHVSEAGGIAAWDTRTRVNAGVPR